MPKVPLTLEDITAKLAESLAITHLTPEEQREVITAMSTVLLDRITMALLGELPPAELGHVQALLDGNQREAVQALIQKHVPNAARVAETVISETVAEYHASLALAASE